MKNLKKFKDSGLIMLKFGGEGYLWDLNSDSSKKIMYDVKMTRHLNT